jgi:ABC-type uncharacterized transport system ATPase subunit
MIADGKIVAHGSIRALRISKESTSLTTSMEKDTEELFVLKHVYHLQMLLKQHITCIK